jgi:uracil-DNA glycosylase family 4
MTSRVKVAPELNAPSPGNVLLVGRDPGEQEVKDGRPFVGEAGHVLDTALPVSGLRREDVNITNVVPWRPKDNEFKHHSPEDVQVGLNELGDLIDKLEPSIIVAMGNEAAWALTDCWPGDTIYHAHGVMERRGYFFEGIDDCWVLSTLHPANVKYKVMPNAMLLELDFRRLDLWLRGELPRQEFPPHVVARSYEDLVRLKEAGWALACDIETKWGSSEVLCVGFCGDDLVPVVIPDDLMPLAFAILASDSPKVFHHGQFDIYMLQEEQGLEINGQLHDTMFQHWALYPELAAKEETGGEYSDNKKANKMTRKGLAFLMSMYGNWPWWKDYPEPGHPQYRELMFQLNGRDCYATRWLHSLQMKKIYEEAVDDQYYEAMDMLPIAIKMQKRGMLVDNELREKRIQLLEERLEKDEHDIVLAGLAHIWEHELESFRHVRSCPCCHGALPGKEVRRKTVLCWSCAGFDRAPTKGMLVERIGEEHASQRKAWLEGAVLRACNFCGGKGYISWYEFNPFSNQQLGRLLYDEIGVPKSLLGKKRQVDEETLGKVLNWARH